MSETNEKMIAWITQRLRQEDIADKPWNAVATDWIASEPPKDGDDQPPDILSTEVAIRLSEFGRAFGLCPHASEPDGTSG